MLKIKHLLFILIIWSINQIQCMEKKKCLDFDIMKIVNQQEIGPHFAIRAINNTKKELTILAMQHFRPVYLNSKEFIEKSHTLKPGEQYFSEPMKVVSTLYNGQKYPEDMFTSFDTINFSTYANENAAQSGCVRIGDNINPNNYLIKTILFKTTYPPTVAEQIFSTPTDDKTVTVEVALNGGDEMEEIKILKAISN